MTQGAVITGASSGIGAALAAQLAPRGYRLLLVARDRGRLDAVAQGCRDRGATVDLAACDVRNAEALGDHLSAFDRVAPVDLLIANAGALGGRAPDGRPEGLAQARRLAEVNYIGVLNTVEPLLPAMVSRGRGRIGLMSSLAAIRPVPTMAGYAGSKAAIMGYGTALRAHLRPFGVTVSIVTPGFVTSPMTARHLGPRPFEISAEHAARLTLRGLYRGRGVVAFPWPLAVLARVGAMLPRALADRSAAWMNADCAPSG